MGPNDVPGVVTPEIRAGWGGVARARAGIPAGCRGLMRPTSAPETQQVDWIDYTRAVPGYQSSHPPRTNTALCSVSGAMRGAMYCGARGSKESRFDADQFVTNAGVLCFVRHPAL